MLLTAQETWGHIKAFLFSLCEGGKKKTNPDWIHRNSTQPLKSKTNDRSSRIYNKNCCDTALVLNNRICALNFRTFLVVFTDKPDHRQIYCKNVRSSKLARHLKTHRALRPSPCQRKRNTKKNCTPEIGASCNKEGNAQETGKREPTEKEKRKGDRHSTDFSETPCRSNK